MTVIVGLSRAERRGTEGRGAGSLSLGLLLDRCLILLFSLVFSITPDCVNLLPRLYIYSLKTLSQSFAERFPVGSGTLCIRVGISLPRILPKFSAYLDTSICLVLKT